MGQEMYHCAQELLTSDDNSEKKLQVDDIKDIPFGLPRRLSVLSASDSDKSVTPRPHPHRHRRTSTSLTQKLNAVETELELLKAQNQHLRKQNQAFIALLPSPDHDSPSTRFTLTQYTPYLSPMTPMCLSRGVSAMCLSRGVSCSVEYSLSCSMQTMIAHSSVSECVAEEDDGDDKDNDSSACVQCTDVENCVAMKRLIIALKWYANCSAKGNFQKLMTTIRQSTYDEFIVGDYQHILRHHSRDLKEQERIRKQVTQAVPACNLSHGCTLAQQQRANDKFDKDFMDRIHCHLMHS